MNLETQLRDHARRVLAHGDTRRIAISAGWHPSTLSTWLTGTRRVKDVALFESLATALGVRLVLEPVA